MPPESFGVHRIRPEDHLLLCCAGLSGGQEKAARIRSLVRENLDWSCVLDLAGRNGTFPALYLNLRRANFEGVPENIRNSLHQQFLANFGRNVLLANELLKLLYSLQDRGISAIPYKGPTLAVLAYGDLYHRQFGDLDLIVRRQDVIKAKDVLLSEGYQPLYSLSQTRETACLAYECQYNFRNISTGVMIELHWKLVESYWSCNLDAETLWDHLVPVCLLERQTMTISPEYLLPVLCIHGGKHRWEQLRWVDDIAQLISSHKDLDWDVILERAARSGIERMLFLGLYLARSMVGADLPPFLEGKLNKDPTLESLAVEVRALIFNENGGRHRELDRWAFFLKMRERLQDKLRYIVRRIFTPTMSDWSLINLPLPVYPLYYLIRPFRLAKDLLWNSNSRYW